jgi:pectin methylesterase-like acyl-CoA thioesterase
MKSKLLIALLVVLVSFSMFGPASASQPGSESDLSNFPVGTTIYVDPSNKSGMEDGTSTFPFNTIQEAVDAAGSDDLVGAAPGIYYEHVLLRAGVSLVGTDPAATIIDGGEQEPL